MIEVVCCARSKEVIYLFNVPYLSYINEYIWKGTLLRPYCHCIWTHTAAHFNTYTHTHTTEIVQVNWSKARVGNWKRQNTVSLHIFDFNSACIFLSLFLSFHFLLLVSLNVRSCGLFDCVYNGCASKKLELNSKIDKEKSRDVRIPP